MVSEEEIRRKVKALKRFYLDVLNYIVVNFIFILVWLTFDTTGTFWPKYILVIWGIVLALRAFRTGVVSLLFPHVSFLSQRWEEQKVRELMRRRNFHRKASLDKDKNKPKK